MILKRIVVGDLETNCYIVGDEKGLAVIDPGADPQKILKVLGDAAKEAGPVAESLNSVIILTHAHPDHTGAVGGIAGELNCPIYMHSLDSKWLKEIFGSDYPGMRNIEEGEVLRAGGISLKVWHTPGHAKGGICLYDEENAVLFSGDTLFAGGIGRTDLPGGNMHELVASLKRLMTLPDGIKVYPGHGEPTTIGAEREYLESMGVGR